MNDITGFENVWDIITEMGGFIIVVIGIISSGCALFLRFRKKLKFVDYHLRQDEGKITAITFVIYNKSSKPISVMKVGCMFNKNKEKYDLIHIPRGISILPKHDESFSHGYMPPADERVETQTNILKRDINRLYISHSASKDYIYRRIDIFKKAIQESGIQ